MTRAKKTNSCAIFLTLLFSIRTETARAALVFSTQSASGEISLLPSNDPRFKVAYEVMMKYQWPSLEEQKTLLKQSENSTHPIIEEKVIETEVKKICKESKLDCSHLNIFWVPPTTWDLLLLQDQVNARTIGWKAPGLSEVKKGQCTIEDQRYDPKYEIDTFKNDSVKSFEYFSCLHGVFDQHLKSFSESPLKASAFNSADLLKLSNQLLLSLETKATQAKNNWITTSFQAEFEGAKKGQPHLLHQVIQDEIKAHQENKVIIWRATRGLAVDDVPKSLDQLHTQFQKNNQTDNPSPTNVIEELSKSQKACTTSDSVLTGSSKNCLNPKTSPSVCDKTALLKKSLAAEAGTVILDFPSRDDLSFSNSILAGILFANGDKGDCTFGYNYSPKSIHSSYYIYKVTLERDQYNSHMKTKTFFPGGAPNWYGLFGSGERFHPRTGYYNEDDQVTSNGGNGTWTRSHPVPEKAVVQKALRISEILASDATKIIDFKHDLVGDSNREQIKKMKEAQIAAHHYLVNWAECHSF